MKKAIFTVFAGLMAAVVADGLATVDDFGGVAGDVGFWDISQHAQRQVHSRTVAVPFDLSPAPQSAHALSAFDSRVFDEATGEFTGRFSTQPAGIIINMR